MPHAQIARWVAEQCYGLAQALAIIHHSTALGSQVGTQSDTYGIHGDIKPANIIRYTDWKESALSNRAMYEPLGLLQLTDFGLSSFHHSNTVEDIKVKIGDSEYKPPEVHLVLPISQSTDIWTLGCLLLEFVTWLVLGEQGREEFRARRTKYKGLNDIHPCFFEVLEDEEGLTRIMKSRAVTRVSRKFSTYTERTRKADSCSQSGRIRSATMQSPSSSAT